MRSAEVLTKADGTLIKQISETLNVMQYIEKDEAYKALEFSRTKWAKKCAELPTMIQLLTAPVGTRWLGQIKGSNTGWILVKNSQTDFKCSW
jgi:hypothetical protein